MSGSSAALTRAYSMLDIKSVDEDARVIHGIASTPEADRTGDVVEPKGASFKLPLPLLWQHRTDEPIGHVLSANVTDTGIEIQARIAKGVSARIDECWALIRAGLVRGLSIGFRPTENPEFIKDSGGLRFRRWEWLELSTVTVPANSSASIQLIKSIATQDLAASGDGQGRTHVGTPGVTGTVVRLAKKDAPTTMTKTYSEQIAAFEQKRAADAARRDEIQSKASAEGRSKDDTEREEFDTLTAEIKSIDRELVDLRELEVTAKANAKPVNGTDPSAASQSRQTSVIQIKSDLPPGIEFARYAMCLMAARGNPLQALEIAKARYPDQPRIQSVLKTAVAGGTTLDATWAGPLVDTTNLASEFIEYLRPMTIIGKFGTGNIPSLRRIPFNVRITGQTSGGDAYWVGQGAPKPLTKFDFNAVTHSWAKVAAIAVISEELARFSSPSAEALVRDALRDAIIARIDTDFVDPDKGAVANVSPASITNNVAPITSAGSSNADVRVDVMNIFAPFIAANQTPSNGVWIMSHTTALALSLMQNALGQREFDGITMQGGTFQGLPVITSQYVRTGSPVTELVILVNASDIFLSDDGQVTLDASREASLQMDDAPTNNSATPTATQVVSMYQTNSIAIKAERFINWSKRRAQAVQFLENVIWGAGGGSPS